jgi:hypothetical protein
MSRVDLYAIPSSLVHNPSGRGESIYYLHPLFGT